MCGLPHRLDLCLPPDSLGWKLFYVTGCLFVAVQNLEDWEVSPARPRGAARPRRVLARGSSELLLSSKLFRFYPHFSPLSVAIAQNEMRGESTPQRLALAAAPSMPHAALTSVLCPRVVTLRRAECLPQSPAPSSPSAPAPPPHLVSKGPGCRC